MHLETKDIVNQPVDRVYALVRDDLGKLVPFLPNIEKIDVIEKEKINENERKVVNHWYSKVDVPAMAKKYLKPEVFAWKDFAVWNDQEKSASFRLESFVGKDLYEAKGKNYFRAIGTDKTEVCISCDITIHADKVPGIPRFLAATLLPVIEGIIAKILEPNLKSLSKGLNGYFKDQN